MVSRPAIGLSILAIVCVLTVTGAVAQSGYALSSPDSTPAPERTVTLEGDSFTVDSWISADPGDEITVDVSAPDEVYRLYVRNGDRQIIDRPRGEGSDSFTIELNDADYDPGTYVVAPHSTDSGQHEAVLPLLVEGYDVSVDAPGSADASQSFDISLDVTATNADGDPAAVTAVLVADDTNETVEATGGDGEYTATVESGVLDEGEYSVYGVVRGTEQAFGEDEVLGLADGGSVTVEAADDSETDGEGGGGAGAGPGDETATPTEGENSTATPTESGTATDTVDNSSEATETATATEAVETTEPMDDATETEEETTDGDAAITPDDNGTEAQTTTADGPGFGGVHLAVALGALLGVLVLRHRSRSE